MQDKKILLKALSPIFLLALISCTPTWQVFKTECLNEGRNESAAIACADAREADYQRRMAVAFSAAANNLAKDTNAKNVSSTLYSFIPILRSQKETRLGNHVNIENRVVSS